MTRFLRSAGLALAVLAWGPAEAAPARFAITGVWKMATGREVTDANRTPPIPAPKLKPEVAARYGAEQAAWKAAEAEGRPFARDRELCIPDGMPRMLTTDSPFDILETPGRITIVHEFMSATRRIDLARRSHPAELDEGFFGDSIGRWDGGVLTVETVGLKPRVLLFNDVPHGPRVRIVERYRLRGPNLLENRVAITDPDVLAEPWVVTRLFVRRPDLRVGESVCQENNRNFRTSDGRLGTLVY